MSELLFNSIYSAVLSSIIISPIMTIIDLSTIKSQLHKENLLLSIKNNLNYLKKIKPFLIMNSVYSSTYSTANITEYYCKKNNINYKIPTLLSTSLINILLISFKDKEYIKLLNKKNIKFPIKSYLLFSIRDIITIFSNFILKNDFIEFLNNHNIVYSNFYSSISIPILSQLFSTPLHILAINIYENNKDTFANRLKNIKKLYIKVCFGRIIRILPAFGIGGYINNYLKN